MIELRFRRDLYAAAAIDEVAELYGPYAKLEREDRDEAIVLRLEGSSPARERRLAGELSNYALGLTIKSR